MIDPSLVMTRVASVQVVGPFDNAEEIIITLFSIILLAIGAGFLYFSLKQFSRAFSIATNRPIQADSVADAEGEVELEGTAQPLENPDEGDGGSATIAYQRERKKKEIERDSDGNRKETWKTVSSSEGASPFKLTDESGEVIVETDDATLSIDMDLKNSSNRRRTYEGRITPGDTVHIFGEKQTADDVEDPPGGASYFVGPGDGDILISDTTQFRTILRYGLNGGQKLLFALVALGFGLITAMVALDLVLGTGPMAILSGISW